MLRYAATPVCLILGLFNAGAEGADPLCGAMGHGSLLGGMATMYFVMAIFHAGPWLRLWFGPSSRFLADRGTGNAERPPAETAHLGLGSLPKV